MIDDIKVDSIEQLPMQLIYLQEQQIVEETNTYIASLGYDIRFNRNQMIKMLKMYQNTPLNFYELKVGDWIYDNYWGEYFEISEVYPKTNEFDVLIHQNKINKRRYETIRFEENRFYRREVNNDE